MKKWVLAFAFLVFALVGFAQTKTEQLDELLTNPIAINADSVKQFLGVYEFLPEFKVSIYSASSKIYAQKIGESEKHLLVPIAKNRFFVSDVEQELEFARDDNGAWNKAILHTGKQPMIALKIGSNPPTLTDTIAQLDKALFDAFNRQDLDKLMSFFSEDLEFFHDLGGLTYYEDNKKAFEENFTSNKKIQRTLVEDSLEVYPIPNYGAIQVGKHTFCHEENNENICGTFKFVHVWQKKNGVWLITRVISYAH